jgi:NAD+ diphosphatase
VPFAACRYTVLEQFCFYLQNILMNQSFEAPVIPFAGGSLDRAEHIRLDDEKLRAALANPEARFLPFNNLEVAITTASPADLYWLKGTQLGQSTLDQSTCIFLGVDTAQQPHFAFNITPQHQSWAAGLDCEFVNVRSAGMQLLDARAAIVAHGRSLLDWHARHGFCAVCGSRSQARFGGAQMKCSSAECGALHFPRTDPVVIMLVESPDGEQCLLGRSHHYGPGMMSTLAGFMEPGESIEDSVRREIMEEAGIVCNDVRYFASQPWPFPSSLMIGCVARAEGMDLTIDEKEIEEAGWFSREDVALMFDGGHAKYIAPQEIAIAHYLLKHWLNSPAQ